MSTLSLFATAALVAAAPAEAQDRRVPVAVAPTTLGDAIVALGRQTGTSIGVRDPAIARMRVTGISGRMSTRDALARMTRDLPVRVRKVASGTWLIERAAAPEPRRPRPAPAVVQTAPDAEPTPDIIVTATKRDTRLTDFAGAATLLGPDAFSDADAARGTEAIEARVASLTSTHLGPGRNKLFIRGIADSSFTGPTQATVGQYWGDTRVTYSAPDPSLRLYDVRSVEVLEGPQGTLYGAGSLGGIIRVQPEAPNLDTISASGWGGVQATQHGAPGGDLGGLFNLPIKEDAIALRAVVYGGIDGGWIDDTKRNKEDVNRVSTLGGRAALRFSPGDDWTIDISGLYQAIKGDDAQYADRDGDGLTRASGTAQPFRNDYGMAELVIRKQWDDLTLVSATGVVDQHVSETFDATMGSRPQSFTQTSRIRMITSETRLSRRSDDGSGWVIGAAVLSNTAKLNREMGLPMITAPVMGVRNRVDEGTLYGEGTVAPFSWLLLTAGGRLTHSRISGSAEDAPYALAFRIEPGASASTSETRFLPSFAATVRPADNLALFARYQEGFRPGGLSLNTDFIRRFEGDRVVTAETGLRYTADGEGGPFDLALTGAYTYWRDIQADLVDGLGFPTTANIGDGRIWSLGVAARWRPVRGLEIDGALYLNDSEVTSPSVMFVNAFRPGAPGAVVGSMPIQADALRLQLEEQKKSLPNVADVTARIGFDWTSEIGSQLLHVRGYGRYVGESRLGVGPILGQQQGDYGDTGLELILSGEQRNISLSVTNLLDARGNRFALGSPFLIHQADQITPLRPRTFRIGFGVEF